MIVCGTDIEPVGANLGDSVDVKQVSTLAFCKYFGKWDDMFWKWFCVNALDMLVQNCEFCFGKCWTLDMLVQIGLCYVLNAVFVICATWNLVLDLRYIWSVTWHHCLFNCLHKGFRDIENETRMFAMMAGIAKWFMKPFL